MKFSGALQTVRILKENMPLAKTPCSFLQPARITDKCSRALQENSEH